MGCCKGHAVGAERMNIEREIASLRTELDALKADYEKFAVEEKDYALLAKEHANDDEHTCTKKDLIDFVMDATGNDGLVFEREEVKAIINTTLKEIETLTALGLTVDLGKFGKFEVCKDYDIAIDDNEFVCYVNFEPGNRYIKKISEYAKSGMMYPNETR